MATNITNLMQFIVKSNFIKCTINYFVKVKIVIIIEYSLTSQVFTDIIIG